MAAAHGDPPAVARQRVRRALRKFREATPWTQGEVAVKLGWSLSKVQRIESGEVGVSPTDLRALLDVYGVSDPDQIERLREDAKSSRRQRYVIGADEREHLTQGHRELMQFEREAVAIRTYQPIGYPGMLQTSAVARAVIARWTSDQEARRVLYEARLARRRNVIDRPGGPDFYVIVDEGVIKRRFVSDEATALQLEYMIEVARKPNVHIRMIPFDRGADMVAMGTFTIVELADEDETAVVYRENFDKDELFHDPARVELHRAAYGNVWDISLSEEATVNAFVAEAAHLHSSLQRRRR